MSSLIPHQLRSEKKVNRPTGDISHEACRRPARIIRAMDLPSPVDMRATADLPIRRCLELAYEALRAGGLACGSVLVAADGAVVAEGRNHAYDPISGSDVIEGSPVAHAEINVLARVPTARDLGADTLWSSQEPCSMCTAAAAFIGVGAIAFVAHDPWALATDQSRAQRTKAPEGADGPPVSGPAPEPWRTIANVLFILSIAATRGADHATVVRSRTLDPVAAEVALELLSSRAAWPATLGELLEPAWDRLQPPEP
jgi:tRNA(Arg) A34 adenosine deaminase TadA